MEEYINYYEGKIIHEDSKAYIELTNFEGNKDKEVRAVNIFMGVDPASSTAQTARPLTVACGGWWSALRPATNVGTGTAYRPSHPAPF